MFYNTSYGGMHFIWWIIWLVLLFWIFATPYDIPGRRTRKETPLEIIRRRLAAGEISADEYQELKKILDINSPMPGDNKSSI
ncbi:MAG: SHOCT domain-containing protein [Terrimonas ferruginea]|uniref:SHOCT domain-containing protein n=1 Tax=Terrimonas ferruginea TaxID=249 RepID=UPI0009296C67|nr:SHOCT domain-containing protein [Terrimonas ferruginea]MBN8784060.1 SHOCT domain-containing protein [Terrimonas ferruginea]OJW41639.1 MAG: hypothetical protein BGO56_17425 [Sphingobacteriales bacterium 48-107]